MSTPKQQTFRGVPLVNLVGSSSIQIRWQSADIIAVEAHLARHRLHRGNHGTLYFLEILDLLLRRDGLSSEANPEAALIISPKVKSSLDYRLQKLAKDGHVKLGRGVQNQHTAQWEDYTRLWAEPGWDGCKQPKVLPPPAPAPPPPLRLPPTPPRDCRVVDIIDDDDEAYDDDAMILSTPPASPHLRPQQASSEPWLNVEGFGSQPTLEENLAALEMPASSSPLSTTPRDGIAPALRASPPPPPSRPRVWEQQQQQPRRRRGEPPVTPPRSSSVISVYSPPAVTPITPITPVAPASPISDQYASMVRAAEHQQHRQYQQQQQQQRRRAPSTSPRSHSSPSNPPPPPSPPPPPPQQQRRQLHLVREEDESEDHPMHEEISPARTRTRPRIVGAAPFTLFREQAKIYIKMHRCALVILLLANGLAGGRMSDDTRAELLGEVRQRMRILAVANVGIEKRLEAISLVLASPGQGSTAIRNLYRVAGVQYGG